jgi:hypothetical protein
VHGAIWQCWELTLYYCHMHNEIYTCMNPGCFVSVTLPPFCIHVLGISHNNIGVLDCMVVVMVVGGGCAGSPYILL